MQVKWWRERGFVIVAGAFVVVGVATAVLSLAGVGDQDDGQAAPAKARTTTARASDSACGMPAGDQRVPLRSPAAHWDRVGEYEVPGATKVGPGVIDGHVRRCYAHSPTGAVFAAVNYAALADTYNDDVSMLRQLTAAGEVRDAALRRGGSAPSDPALRLELVGFRVTDYAPAEATVILASRVTAKVGATTDLGPTGARLVSLMVRLRWERSDWKVVADPAGFQAEPLDSIAGLVPWAAS